MSFWIITGLLFAILLTLVWIGSELTVIRSNVVAQTQMIPHLPKAISETLEPKKQSS
jgi:hypothetical protein